MNIHVFTLDERHSTKEYLLAPLVSQMTPQSGGYTSPFNIRRGMDGRLWLNRHGTVFPDQRGMQFVLIRQGDAGHWYCQVHAPSARIAEFEPSQDWEARWPTLPDESYCVAVTYQGEWK